MRRRGDTQDPWGWLTQTWLGPVLSLIVLISAPLLFVEERGFVWTAFIAFVATAFWWWTTVLNAWEPRTLFHERSRKYNNAEIGLRALVPAVFLVLFLLLLSFDISRLDVWRRPYKLATVHSLRHGKVYKYFGDTAPRDTPIEREQYERAEWIRWLESGAQQRNQGAELLFVETKPFANSYHTFSLEVHDLSKQVRPCPTAIAFIVSEKAEDHWRRQVFRQVPCELVGDAKTRLFRVLVEEPNAQEYLWLFLCVTPTTDAADLNGLNLQLMVR